MKSIQRCFLFLLWAVLAAAAPINGAKAAPTVTTDQVKAEFLVHAPQGLRPGVAAWLGLKIVHKKGWHTYWVNPGDSGLPTQLQWQLPSGLKAGEIQWPVPQRLPIGPLMNHGYEGTLLLAVPLTVEQPLPETPQKIQLRADWLVCEDVCIPEGGDFSLTLPAGASRSALAKDSALFDQARASLPVEWSGASAAAQVNGQGLTLTLKGLPPAWQGRKLAIFPVAAHVLSPSVEPRAQWAADGAWAATLAYSAQRMEAPAAMEFVVALEQPSTKGASRAPPVSAGDSSPAGIVLTASVGGAWPAADAAGPSIAMGASGGTQATGGTDAAGSGAGASTPKADAGWWTAAVLAVLGGLILNLMPCVFPVLSLKVFGFAADAHNRRALALGGLAYSLGVVLSFVALSALLLALRASGEQLGWGFQLQSPPFVAALALLFTLMGLNLLGQFEFAMMVPGRWAAARARHPVVDHFLTGVLAVVVASPCTAPFMGASLGVAVTLPTLQALGIFAALGLGMAAPYLLLSLMPGWAARLPRPGAWMLKVKHAMALPMLATVVWLLWVLGHQAGVDAAAALLGLMLLMAFGIGAWGWAASLSGVGRLASRALVLALVLGTASGVWPLLKGQPEVKATSADTHSDWAPWSPQAMEQELGQGRTVFVDYTAAWCVTCQANKRTTLRREEVLQALRERGIVTMEADWTRQDETITRELTRLGRSGVPVYAFYRSGADPVLLPEVLTPALMLNAIDKLPR